jgi:hypothetical protein
MANYLETLKNNNGKMLSELIAQNNLNVNTTIKLNIDDEYTATLLSIAIVYHALMKKDTIECVKVLTEVVRI